MDFSKISKAISDSTRFEILKEITKHDTVHCTELTKIFDITQPAVSHHLKVLGEANLITAKKKGQFTYVSANNDVLHNYMNFLKKSLGL